MREELGVLLMEQENGEIAVQLFSDLKGFKSEFANLQGSPAEKPSRATGIFIEYGKEGTQHKMKVKNLPIIKSKTMTGYKLGVGHCDISKEGKVDDKSDS